ncbi:MAG: fluoride efflux transporter CrcB [Planctomycetota bacterium]
MNLIWIAVGGGLGAVARYLVASAVQAAVPGFKPFGTMAVNVIGCLLVGMIMAWIVRINEVGSPMHFFLVTGILGGFTTFSAFGYETVSLIEEQQLTYAFWNVAGNLGLGLPAVFLGLKLATWLVKA